VETENYNQLEKKGKIKLGILTVILIIIALEIGYLCFVQFQSKILIVDIESVEAEDLDEADYSDSIQIQNALDNGGMIVINLESNWLKNNFDSNYNAYGANDSNGYMYILGGVINYTASKGWKLIQGPTSGLSNIYYFER